MQQIDQDSFRTKESAFKQFRRTCLGKIVIASAVVVILLVIAFITNPSPNKTDKMKNGMEDNIKQSIWSRDSINADGLDIFIANIGHTFTQFDEQETEDMKRRWNLFINSNDTSYHDHLFYSTMKLNCRFKGEETGCGIGIFGMVIPTVDFNKYVPGLPLTHDSIPSMQIGGKGDEEYFGTTTVDIFRWEGE